MRKNIIDFYKKNGWVIVRNFYNKQLILKIKKELIKNSSKKNKFFYYENIKNKPKLRRIEKVTDFSKNSKNILCSKNTISLINDLEKNKYILFKDKLNFKFPEAKDTCPILMVTFIGETKIRNIRMGGKNTHLILLI